MKESFRHCRRTWFLACASICLLGPANVIAGERFVLGAEDEAGPWGGRDGAGCGNDLVRAAFVAAGETVTLEILPYARAKKMAMNGELAGCFAMSWEPELEGKIVFAREPLYEIKAILLVRRGGAAIRSLDDIPPRGSLGLVKDYEYPLAVRAVAKREVRIEEVASEVQNMKKLAAGRIDATVVNCDPLKSLEHLLRKAGTEGKVESVAVLGEQGSFVGFSLRHPAGALARERFDAGMQIIRGNGTAAAIIRQWTERVNHR